MKVVFIDCNKLNEKTTAHEYLASRFGFPDYYGRNLDALDDCLCEQPKGTLVILENRASAGDYAERVIEVFEDMHELGRIEFTIR